MLAKVENLAANSDEYTQKMEEIHAQKLKALETQVKCQAVVHKFLIDV